MNTPDSSLKEAARMGVYRVPNKNTVTADDIETISVDELHRQIGIDVFPAITDRALRDQAEVLPIAEQGRYGGRVTRRDWQYKSTKGNCLPARACGRTSLAS